MKTNKGITLVALVITIIVLLILAGVSISLVVGDNGVLTQSQKASENTTDSQIREDFETAIAGQQTTFMADWADHTNISLIKTSDATPKTYSMNDTYLEITNATNDKIDSKMTTGANASIVETVSTSDEGLIYKVRVTAKNSRFVEGYLIVKPTTVKVTWDTSTTPTL